MITTEPIGKKVFRADKDLGRANSPEREQGTPDYVMLADIVRHVGAAGPVLVFKSTRRTAAAMAQAIAVDLEDRPECAIVSEIAEDVLSVDHPLPALLLKGVAFHHAGLPLDIQELIEDQIKSGILTYVVATTTLAEGVNLPVRTVVLDADPYPGQPVEQQMLGSRLINAVGRAGRATKESEGWVILARHAAQAESDFELLQPPPRDLVVNSTLADESALTMLAQFEEAVRRGEDSLLAAKGEISDFAQFIWFVLVAEEELGRAAIDVDPIGAFQSTLAYSQLEERTRRRYEAALETVRERYFSTPADMRKRWSRTGTGLSSASALDNLAGILADEILNRGISYELTPQETLELIDSFGSFTRFMELVERPARGLEFKERQSPRAETFQVDPAELISEWIAGASLRSISSRLFGRVVDPRSRIESAVDTVTDYCEHYLSWMISALVTLTNSRLDELGVDVLSRELPVLVRYGATTMGAVELLTSGLHSREVANAIAAAAKYEGVDPGRMSGSTAVPVGSCR